MYNQKMSIEALCSSHDLPVFEKPQPATFWVNVSAVDPRFRTISHPIRIRQVSRNQTAHSPAKTFEPFEENIPKYQPGSRSQPRLIHQISNNQREIHRFLVLHQTDE
jgi:hypothetical protein